MTLKGVDRWKAIHEAVKKNRPSPAPDPQKPASERTEAISEILLDRSNYESDDHSVVFGEIPPARVAQRLDDDGNEPRTRRTRLSAKSASKPARVSPPKAPPLDPEELYRLKYVSALKALANDKEWKELDSQSKVARVGKLVGVLTWVAASFLTQHPELCRQYGIEL